MARATSPKAKVTVSQLRILLEAIEDDSSLYNAGNSDTKTFLNIEKWINLADRLNACPGGAVIPVQNWKYVLRYWSETTMKKMLQLKGKKATRKLDQTMTREEVKELQGLEKRLFNFLKREEARKFVGVTYVGKFFGDSGPNGDGSSENGGGVRFMVQLLNFFPGRNDENHVPGCPFAPKKRTNIMKNDDVSNTHNSAKKFKVIYDQNVDQGDPQKHILENQLDRIEDESRDLQDHIATVQSRIRMIKDLWKHRCGDN